MTDPDGHAPLHRDASILAAGMAAVRQAPADDGAVRLLVVRPDVDRRETPPEVTADAVHGILGDGWARRGSTRIADGSADPDAQVTVMNVRAALLVAGSMARVPLAGDQVHVDLDVGTDNMAVGTRLHIGVAVLEVTAHPHTGCVKFAARFGPDALRLTATPEGRALRLRGVNTRIVTGGVLRLGDRVAVVGPADEGPRR